MKTIAWWVLVAALACGAGCARPDWIEQTLVTVDVSGTWQGSTGGSRQFFSEFEFFLEQQGPKVHGSVRQQGRHSPWGTAGEFSGLIDGTVAGDVFSFRRTTGSFSGEMTVSGDEMTGMVSGATMPTRPINLRRVNSSVRPSVPER